MTEGGIQKLDLILHSGLCNILLPKKVRVKSFMIETNTLHHALPGSLRGRLESLGPLNCNGGGVSLRSPWLTG